MFEERLRDYKRGLAEEAERFIARDERIQVVALAQERVPPWVQYGPYALGLVGFVGGIGLMPAGLGISLIVVGIAGAIVSSQLTRRRLLVRTEENVYAFALPASGKASLKTPLAVHRLSDLPAAVGVAGKPRLDGVRLYPNFGASGEEESIRAALAPTVLGRQDETPSDMAR